MLAIFAASTTSSMETFRSLSPYIMFSAMVRSKSTGSWETIPSWPRMWSTLRLSILRPSRVCEKRRNEECLTTALRSRVQLYIRKCWKCKSSNLFNIKAKSMWAINLHFSFATCFLAWELLKLSSCSHKKSESENPHNKYLLA